MSEGDVAPAIAPAVAAAASAAPGQVTDITEAIKVVLKKAIAHDGVVRGLREGAKALDRKEAHLAILAEDCDEPAYTRLVTALCKQHNINLLKVPARAELGEWAGLCKYDKERQARKVVKTSLVVIRNYGEATPELDFVLEHFKSKK